MNSGLAPRCYVRPDLWHERPRAGNWCGFAIASTTSAAGRISRPVAAIWDTPEASLWGVVMGWVDPASVLRSIANRGLLKRERSRVSRFVLPGGLA
jgi:hypothetical protein